MQPPLRSTVKGQASR